MARFEIKTLVNPTDNDFVDKWDGDEYVVPAHGELAVPDFIAYHFCGDGTPEDRARADLRRGEGGQLRGDKKLGVTVYIKTEEEKPETEILVENGKPIATVKKVSKKE